MIKNKHTCVEPIALLNVAYIKMSKYSHKLEFYIIHLPSCTFPSFYCVRSSDEYIIREDFNILGKYYFKQCHLDIKESQPCGTLLNQVARATVKAPVKHVSISSIRDIFLFFIIPTPCNFTS